MSEFGNRRPDCHGLKMTVFCNGRAQFCADIVLPGTLHAAFVRSPHAHARILSGRKPSGFEKSVYFADDLAGLGRLRSTAKMPGFKPSDWPILAKGKVRHVGEPVAMVIGASPAEAEDIAALVEVGYEPLPPIVSMADAQQKRQHCVHEEWGDNVLVEIKLENGDLAAAKAAAVHPHRAQLPHEPDAPVAARGPRLHRAL